MTYKPHDLSLIFPDMSGEDFTRLAGSIAIEGLLEPITLFEGKILDGRHRYKACLEANVEPRFEEFSGDEDAAKAYSIATNMARRHLTAGQRAALGNRLKEYEAKQAQKRQHLGQHIVEGPKGRADEIAAAAAGSNRESMRRAAKIEAAAPEVHDLIAQGVVSIPEAEKVARLNPEVRKEVVTKIVEHGLNPKQAMTEERGEPEGDINNTPMEWIELARSVMEDIDLDPATNADAQEMVKAAHFFMREDDGLSHEWFGRVWCNPPYSNGLIGRFADKILSEWESGRVESMVILTNASACSAWWHKLASAATRVGFPKSRINFWRGHAEQGNSNNYDQSLFYFGSNAGDFDKAMADAGHLPMQITRGAQ